jgi:hypothetical protein
MSPIVEPPNEYASRLRDAILERSALTDDMLDEEAQVFLDWAMTQADRVGLLIQSEEEAETKRDALMDWLKDISRLVTLRHAKDADWFATTLTELDAHAQAIGAMALSPEHQTALAQHSSKSTIELLSQITGIYAPTEGDQTAALEPAGGSSILSRIAGIITTKAADPSLPTESSNGVVDAQTSSTPSEATQ